MEVFTDSFIPPGPDDVWFATRGCPACLDTPFARVRGVHAPHGAGGAGAVALPVGRGLLEGDDSPCPACGCGEVR
jgi:hypothetical protein